MKHRMCSRCDKAILRTHRWHYVHKRFLWSKWRVTEHRDCGNPTMVWDGPVDNKIRAELGCTWSAPAVLTRNGKTVQNPPDEVIGHGV
jgi:hypothetical protein